MSAPQIAVEVAPEGGRYLWLLARASGRRGVALPPSVGEQTNTSYAALAMHSALRLASAARGRSRILVKGEGDALTGLGPGRFPSRNFDRKIFQNLRWRIGSDSVLGPCVCLIRKCVRTKLCLSPHSRHVPTNSPADACAMSSLCELRLRPALQNSLLSHNLMSNQSSAYTDGVSWHRRVSLSGFAVCSLCFANVLDALFCFMKVRVGKAECVESHTQPRKLLYKDSPEGVGQRIDASALTILTIAQGLDPMFIAEVLYFISSVEDLLSFTERPTSANSCWTYSNGSGELELKRMSSKYTTADLQWEFYYQRWRFVRLVVGFVDDICEFSQVAWPWKRCWILSLGAGLFLLYDCRCYLVFHNVNA
uniref:Uncharacterized protein n=1 Tax=Timema bartmani TaxID=61472 RepID=A0A7R9HZD7_9NEOP|nr:unnamed protein product [Timema bartmani]